MTDEQKQQKQKQQSLRPQRPQRPTHARASAKPAQAKKSSSNKLVWFSLIGLTCFFIWFANLLAYGKELRQEEIIGQRIMAQLSNTPSDTIIVLTGGSMRIERGLELLEANIADNLFISGVYKGTEVRELLTLSQKNKEELDCCVHLGYEAEDTEGNAAEVAAWMTKNDHSTAHLVTANYHMKRALMIFANHPDLEGVELLPVYVTPREFNLEKWRSSKKMRKIVINEYHKYLYAKLKFFFINISS